MVRKKRNVVYNREAAMNFIALYEDYSSHNSCEGNYREILTSLKEVRRTELEGRVDSLLDGFSLDDHEKEIVLRRYGLKDGKPTFGMRLDDAVRRVLVKLHGYALRRRDAA